MAFDEGLAEKVRAILATKPGFSEKKMFGGLCFMLAGNMCCGIMGNKLMLRVKPETQAAWLARPHVQPMTFTGRPLKGMIYVMPEGVKRFSALARWVELSVNFVKTLPKKTKPAKRGG